MLVDWPRHAEWMFLTTAEGGDKEGDVIVARTGLGPIGFTDTMEITHWSPATDTSVGRCEVRHVGRLVRGQGAFAVVPLAGGRSRIVWAENLELPFGALGLLGWAFVHPLASLFLRRSLRKLARLAAAEATGGGAKEAQ
ncbi:MAG: SRPBCC family protein [Streptosporangiales bacterium]|nr:SRPBCC family protein [Streptosporangiales bacterium]